jgi:hypothetical protein
MAAMWFAPVVLFSPRGGVICVAGSHLFSLAVVLPLVAKVENVDNKEKQGIKSAIFHCIVPPRARAAPVRPPCAPPVTPRGTYLLYHLARHLARHLVQHLSRHLSRHLA